MLMINLFNMRLRNKILLCLTLILSGASTTFAATYTEKLNGVALGAIIATLIIIVIACFVLLKTFRIMSAMIIPKQEEPLDETRLRTHEETAAVRVPSTDQKLTWWQKVLSLRPLEEEKQLLIMHDYDEIQELDNPIPAWFNWLFYGSIVFAIVYMLHYHVFKTGPLQDEEYAIEMKQAEQEKQVFLAKSGNIIDENSVKLSTDAGVLESGKAVYVQNCVACHGQGGEGIVGPNLTDEFWIHGGTVNDIFKVIKYGVPEKGMISWEKQLTPQQISDVSNYIESLKGTNPPNPKAPQGDKAG